MTVLEQPVAESQPEMQQRVLRARWLGTASYREVWDLQEQLFAGTADHLLLVEHPPVYTIGRSGDPTHLLVDPESVGAEFHTVNRGGDVTFHGPGQIVGYPILTVPGKRGGGMADTVAYVHRIEQAIIEVLGRLGLTAGRSDGYPGVWLDPDGERARKIAAIGVRLSRGRSMHGFALNLDVDQTWFDNIVPCGIADRAVTSIAAEGVPADRKTVVDLLVAAMAEHLAPGLAVERSDVVFRHRTTDLSLFSQGHGPGEAIKPKSAQTGAPTDGGGPSAPVAGSAPATEPASTSAPPSASAPGSPSAPPSGPAPGSPSAPPSGPAPGSTPAPPSASAPGSSPAPGSPSAPPSASAPGSPSAPPSGPAPTAVFPPAPTSPPTSTAAPVAAPSVPEAREGVPVRLKGRLDQAGVQGGLSIATRKPSWMRVNLRTDENFRALKKTARSLDLTTVCEEAGCPNIFECWNEGTATFMLLGERCTRACGFCLIDTRKPDAVDWDEPARIAEAVEELGLRFAVLTMVARDDLTDGGAALVAATVRAIKERTPDVGVEVLISDLQGSADDLETVLAAKPDIINHNMETVARLQRAVRPSAGYSRSLALLARSRSRGFTTKSGLIVGMGETFDEVVATLGDLAAIGVDVVTIGQYLRPTSHHLPIHRWWEPAEFEELTRIGQEELGIAHVSASPLTRSSHHAGTIARSIGA
ncbi:MAG: lipoyl synthase [Actinomycetota bacterium]